MYCLSPEFLQSVPKERSPKTRKLLGEYFDISGSHGGEYEDGSPPQRWRQQARR
jgi:hypothetical protein